MKKLIFTGTFLILIIHVIAQTPFRKVLPKTIMTEVPEYLNQNEVVIKIIESEESNQLSYSLFSDEMLFDAVISSLTGLSYDIKPLFTLPLEKLLKQKADAEAATGRPHANLGLYYQIILNNCTAEQCLQVRNSILYLDKIETAYFPLKIVANKDPETGNHISLRASPDLSSGQKYLQSAPAGIDAVYAWSFAGGKGADIRFCDVERDAYRDHEELLTPPITDVSSLTGYTFGNQHGTATCSEVLADHDGSGVNGIAPDAIPYFSTICADVNCSSYNQANGIATATDTLRAGDVMLLEVQTVSPYPFGLPQEYDQASFDAIQIATSLGIAVVEAAGNGSNDLDSPSFGGAFDTTQKYSGAFIIGAANADTSVSGSTWPPRGRCYFSSFGSRIDFFGWGEMVTTAGYGDLYGSSMSDYYTATFSGTSSASPIVTGAVVALQGIYKAQTSGNVLPLNMLRDILKNTGTSSFDPLNDKIGVMPNLKAAIDTLMIILSTEKQLSKQTMSLQIAAYPNPTNDFISIDCYSSGNTLNITLFNASGQILYNSTEHSTDLKFAKRIDVSDLQSGLYFLKVSDGTENIAKKIIRN